MAAPGVTTTCEPNWFCVRSHPKHEHIAAAKLSAVAGVVVFNPRLRRRTVTRRGLVWVTEPLFPGYLFAQFKFESMLDRVRYTASVTGVVHFGESYPTLSGEFINELRVQFGENEITTIENALVPGSDVTIIERPFYGLAGKILRVMPAKQRVQVLLEILGRTTQLELDAHSVIVERSMQSSSFALK